MLMCPTLCIGRNPREYFKIFDSVQEVLVSMMCLLSLLWLQGCGQAQHGLDSKLGSMEKASGNAC